MIASCTTRRLIPFFPSAAFFMVMDSKSDASSRRIRMSEIFCDSGSPAVWNCSSMLFMFIVSFMRWTNGLRNASPRLQER